MMKIVYLSTFYPYRGGIAQFNALLAKSLSKLANVYPFTFKRQYPELFFPGTTQYVQSNDNAEVIDSIRSLDTINPLTYFTTAKKINAISPDLILTKFWMPFFAPSLGSVLNMIKKGIIRISILDNVEPHEKQPASRLLTKFFLRQNDGFVVMSKKVANDLLNYLPQAKILQLQHPLYTHFGEKIDKSIARKKLKLPADKKILLFFGFIRNYKGLDILLETIPLLDESYHLVVAGECYGPFDSYANIIQRQGIQSRVSLFIRFISDNEVPLFFSSADVCILPYKNATQSGIVGISYHFDLPVIATDVGGLKEMIDPFGSGNVVSHPDPILLRDAIESYFLSEKEKFIDGIRKYKEIAKWDYFAERLLNFYEDLKESKRTSNNIM